jgi:hypothetical protein
MPSARREVGLVVGWAQMPRRVPMPSAGRVVVVGSLIVELRS